MIVHGACCVSHMCTKKVESPLETKKTQITFDSLKGKLDLATQHGQNAITI